MLPIPELSASDITRFNAKVDRSGRCWIWLGGCNNEGYGQFRISRMVKGRRASHYLAHRVAWYLAHGRQPQGFVLHSCDTPTCVRADHLRDGSHAANMRDMVARGRTATPRAKLTPAQVVAIRSLYAGGDAPTQQELAERFGVAQAQVSRAINRKTWRNI